MTHLNCMLITLALFSLKNSQAQNIVFPDTAAINKYHIKYIKVYKYDTDTFGNTVGKGFKTSTYKINKKGLLLEANFVKVNYNYFYDSLGHLVMIQDKWDAWTNRTLSGTKYSCKCLSKDTGMKATAVRTYISPCKDLKTISQDPTTLTYFYIDEKGRDTLVRNVKNNWYYNFDNTGYSKYTYTKLDSNITQLTIKHVSKKNTENEVWYYYEDTNGKITKIYTSDTKCYKTTYHYNETLLTKKLLYNCINQKSGLEIYRYTFYRSKKYKHFIPHL